MSSLENFLARWSRRKRQAAQRQAKPEASPGAAPDAPTLAEAAAAETALPAIESINAATDLAPFLASGLPGDIARAALRRAWTTDPAIRDFVGLCENGWDFNALGGVPGFGALTGEEVRRLIAALAREPDAAPASPISAAAAPEPDTPAANNAASQQNQEKPVPLPAKRRHGGALPK